MIQLTLDTAQTGWVPVEKLGPLKIKVRWLLRRHCYVLFHCSNPNHLVVKATDDTHWTRSYTALLANVQHPASAPVVPPSRTTVSLQRVYIREWIPELAWWCLTPL